MKSQKDAVVELTLAALGSTFVPGVHSALAHITEEHLFAIKADIASMILAGTVAYSKPLVAHEVRAYARSMVMNHMKKARELNGGLILANSVRATANNATKSNTQKTAYKGIKTDILPQELQDLVKTL